MLLPYANCGLDRPPSTMKGDQMLPTRFACVNSQADDGGGGRYEKSIIKILALPACLKATSNAEHQVDENTDQHQSDGNWGRRIGTNPAITAIGIEGVEFWDDDEGL